MRRLLAVVVVAVLFSACALRPRYSSLITPQMTGVQVLQVVDLRGAPMAGVKVDIGENKSRVSVVTRDDGTFSLPVDKKLQADDPVFVVAVPVGSDGYQLRLAPAAPPAPPPPPPAAPAPAP
jgi:hypothetical protein